jgi:hypothetical protein
VERTTRRPSPPFKREVKAMEPNFPEVSMKLEGWYVTGLVEGEGCFSVSFNLRRKFSAGIETRLSFSLSLNKENLELIKALREFFECGGIRYSKFDRTYKFEVRSIKDLREKIIPHFKKFPLQGEKRRDFETFEKICDMVARNLHLSRKSLPEIIELAYQMNPSGKRKYPKEKLLRLLAR